MVSTEPILTKWGEELPSPMASLRVFRQECLRVHDLTLLRRDLPLRVLMRIKVNLVTGCWEWQGRRDKDDYGQVMDEETRETVQVHCYVYERRVGPIPPDLPKLDHRCRNHPCCWDAHVDPKTHAHNVQAGAEARYHIRSGQAPLDWSWLRRSD